jgi:hypothetical protein
MHECEAPLMRDYREFAALDRAVRGGDENAFLGRCDL